MGIRNKVKERHYELTIKSHKQPINLEKKWSDFTIVLFVLLTFSLFNLPKLLSKNEDKKSYFCCRHCEQCGSRAPPWCCERCWVWRRGGGAAPELQAASGSSGSRAGHQPLSRAACCGFAQRHCREEHRGMLLSDVSLTHSSRWMIEF